MIVYWIGVIFSSPAVRAAFFAHRVLEHGVGFFKLGLLLQPTGKFGDASAGGRSSRQDHEERAGVGGRAHVALAERQDQLPQLHPLGDEPAPPERDALTVDRSLNELVVVGEAQRPRRLHAVRLRQVEPYVPAEPRVTALGIIVMQQYLSGKVLGRR